MATRCDTLEMPYRLYGNYNEMTETETVVSLSVQSDETHSNRRQLVTETGGLDFRKSIHCVKKLSVQV